MRTFLVNGTSLVAVPKWEPNCWVNITKPTQEDKDYAIETFLKLEKCLVYFTTSLRGNDILTHRLKNLRSSKEVYDPELVEDVEIESKQALGMTNIYSDILSGMMDAYASVISNNLNMVMKRLTTISIVFMMPTLIASFFGMNLEVGTTIFNWTFIIIVIATIALTAVTTWLLIKKKWF